MEDYKPNSHKYRERTGPPATAEDSAVKREKVTSGKVSTKKQPLTRKITDELISSDAVRIKNYVLYDIAIPAFKKLLVDAICNSAEMMFFGDTKGRSRSNNSSSGARRIPYNSLYDDTRARRPVATRIGYEFDEVQFESRADAEMVLDQMCREIESYDMVSVAAMYDFAGVDITRHTDWNYGWTSLRDAEVRRSGNGYYYLQLPRVKSLAD